MESLPDENQALIDIEAAFTALFRVPQMQRLHEFFNQKAGVDLDRPSYIALGALYRGAPMRIADLAEAAGVDHSTMSRLVSRLLLQGLIEGETDPSDRRAQILRLSSRGEQVVVSVVEIRREGLRSVLADWTPEERQTFARLLSRFATGVEQSIRKMDPHPVRMN